MACFIVGLIICFGASAWILLFALLKYAHWWSSNPSSDTQTITRIHWANNHEPRNLMSTLE